MSCTRPTSGEPGDWSDIQYNNATNVLHDAIIRFGGAREGFMVLVGGSAPAVFLSKDSVLESPSRTALFLQDANAAYNIDNVSFRFTGMAIDIQSGNLTSEHSTFAQYSGAGINVSGNGRATVRFCNLIDTEKDIGVRNQTTSAVIAQSNWWDHATGPTNVGPGLGVRVSTNVNYANWLTAFVNPPTRSGPRISSLPNLYALYGAPYAYDADHRATAVGTGGITWSKIYGPDAFAIDAATGEITWVPIALGTSYIVIKVQDGVSTDFQNFSVYVDVSAGDPVPPRVASFNYTLGGMPGPLTAELTASFTESVLVESSDIAVLDSANQSVPFSTYTYSITNNALTVTVPGLSNGQTYRLVLTDTITDWAGNALDDEFNGYAFPTGNGAAGGHFAAVFVAQLTLARLRFDTITRLPNGQYQLTLSGINGNIEIQSSTNLVNWAALTNGFSATGSIQFTDPAAATQDRRFYRAREVRE